MTSITAFALNMLASACATVLVAGLLWFFSRTVRRALTVATSSLLGVDVEYVFPTTRAAFDDMQREFRATNELLLIAGRGLELPKEQFKVLFESKEKAFRILLQDPAPSPGPPDWLASRRRELAEISDSYEGDLYREQLENSARFALEHEKRGNATCRLFNAPVPGRVLITDRVVYFHPTRKAQHGVDTPVIKYRRGGEMYDCYRRYFEVIWEQSIALPKWVSDKRVETGGDR